MDPKLIITVLFLISATVIAAQEYVRPPPRKALHFPWSRKPSSLPQQADLSKVDRQKTPWLLVLFHVPWYNSNKAHQGEGDSMMAAMEPLLYAASADIVFAGHVHAYERTKRVNNGKSDTCGAVHITIGDGGNKEGLAHKYKNPPPEWSVFREASFGHGELNIVNSTHAFWTWHRNDDDEPVRSDQVWITSLVSSGCVAEKTLELTKILTEP
ncbi:hypothetical protein C1H46_027333 [Malus baccata]|uniref:acid phosphatase n=2 Tax=Malus TaxID=3749 RepID=A0A540LKY5_MALBA|nr:hypothetical protein C1H46_027333 [Malus baccata]